MKNKAKVKIAASKLDGFVFQTESEMNSYLDRKINEEIKSAFEGEGYPVLSEGRLVLEEINERGGKKAYEDEFTHEFFKAENINRLVDYDKYGNTSGDNYFRVKFKDVEELAKRFMDKNPGKPFDIGVDFTIREWEVPKGAKENPLKKFEDAGFGGKWDQEYTGAYVTEKVFEYKPNEVKGKTTVSKAQVVAELKKLGIEVKDGKIKKSDIAAALSTTKNNNDFKN